MRTRNFLAAFLAVAWALPALRAGAQTPAAAGPAVTIVNSGSTNFAPYTAVVSPGGGTLLTQAGVTGRREIPSAAANALFHAVLAAGPLDGLALERCMKSASFGVSIRVEYAGKRSPDLTCPGNAKATALYAAVRNVEDSLGVARRPRRAATEPGPSPS